MDLFINACILSHLFIFEEEKKKRKMGKEKV